MRAFHFNRSTYVQSHIDHFNIDHAFGFVKGEILISLDDATHICLAFVLVERETPKILYPRRVIKGDFAFTEQVVVTVLK